MPHDDVRQIGNHMEFFRDGKQITLCGQQIANVDPDYSVAKLFEDFYATELGEEFLATYDLDTINPRTGLTNAQTVEKIFAKLYSHDLRMTLTRVTDTIRTAIDSGSLTPKPQEVVALRVRDESGQFAKALDLEVKRLAAENPSEITRRVRVDREFAAAVDRVMYARPTTPAPVVSDPELLEFARLYTHQPVPRPINGEYFYQDGFGGRRYSVPEFNGLVERCVALKLL